VAIAYLGRINGGRGSCDLMLFLSSAYRWLRALDGFAPIASNASYFYLLRGLSLLLPPLAHHMDLHQEPDMELSLIYVLNPISLRDRGELVPASELASYPVDQADVNELVYSVSPVEAWVTLIPWRPLQKNLLRMLTLERFATATLCRMGDILRRSRLIDGNL